MRILALSSWWPEPPDNGIRLRITHLLRALAREHEVHLIALSQRPVQPEEVQRLEQVCASVRATPQRGSPLTRTGIMASLWLPEPASVRATWNLEFERLLVESAASVRPDLVIAFEFATAPYARRLTGVPWVLEALEVAHLLEQYIRAGPAGRRLRSWLTWAKHRRYVKYLLSNCLACTTPSAREQDYIRAFAPRSLPITVVPNGADVETCAGDWGEPEPGTLIYPGALTYDANHDAMAFFLGACFPLIRAGFPDVRLRITGKAEPEQRESLPTLEGVEFTGYVPDVRPVIARSWAEVVPLRRGGGTRLKVLEALALGTPVVSTSKGIEGLDLDHGQHILVADSAVDFAEATLRLLAEPSLRHRLAQTGRQRVRERYDWRMIGRQLNDLIREVTRR